MDQVPTPLVIELDDTWDTTFICRHVCVSQQGAGSNKHFCSIKLFFRQSGIQPNIAVIFWVTGKGVTDVDKRSYEDDVLFSEK